MKKKDVKVLILSFLTWRVLLFAFLFAAVALVPLQKDFLGGGLKNYLAQPWFWGFINFDGEHYLSIAQQGYRPLTYFFFPVYPLAVKFFAEIFSRSILSYAVSGLLISHISFLVALFGLWKLTNMDFDKKVSVFTILLLLIFPTSFYFASFYTESLFLALTVWSFYFARNKKWILAGTLGGFATATRIVGLALIPAFLVEVWLQRKENKKERLTPKIIGLLIIPAGILLYMYCLKVKTGDPFEFFNTVSIFGEQRASGLVLLPQVFYRYIFKILPNLNYSYFPLVFTSWLEVISALLFLLLSIFSFLKTRLSSAVYTLVAYLIPTFSGSFSSMPRYVLVLFPAFVVLSIYLAKLPKVLQVLLFSLLFICLGIATSLFVRGYWVS